MILSIQTLACDKKSAPLVERVKGFTGNYVAAIHVLHVSTRESSSKAPVLTVMIFEHRLFWFTFMTGRFSLFSNAAPCAMHPGQNWLFKDPSVDV